MDNADGGAGAATIEAPPVSETQQQAPEAPVESTPTPEAAGVPTDAQPEAAAQPEGNPLQIRENALISHTFGLSDADLADFTPSARARLLAQAESRLIDNFAANGAVPPAGRDGAPQAPNVPNAAPAAPQAPKAAFDLSPHFAALEQQAGPEVAAPFREALTAMQSHYDQKIERLNQMEQAFAPMAERFVAFEQAQEKQAVEAFYNNLTTTQPGWKSIIGGPEGEKVKQQAYQAAVQIVRNNPGADPHQALMTGLLQASKIPLSQLAMKNVQGQIAKRSKNITTAPGASPSRGSISNGQAAPQTTREKMLAAIERTEAELAART